MTFEEFHNALRIMRSIDLHELQAVGLWTDDVKLGHQWIQFRNDPYNFFTRADEDTARKIWQVIENRQPKSIKG